MTTTIMHFSIAGDWLTNTVRSLWADGKMNRAMTILGDIRGLDEATKMEIILGKKKFIGESGDDNGLELVDDDATEINGVPLLTAEQIFKKKDDELNNREKIISAKEDWISGQTEKISSQWGLIKVPRSLLTKGYRKGSGSPYFYLEDENKKIYESLFSEEIEEAKSRLQVLINERMMRDRMFMAGLNPAAIDQIHASGNTVLDTVLKGGFEQEFREPFRKQEPEPEKVKPDKKLNGLNGWISPSGEFYSCGFMGHIKLASDLNATEGELEKLWVKVQNVNEPLALIPREGESDFTSIPYDGVTQAQYDTMCKWSIKHKRPSPDDIKIKD